MKRYVFVFILLAFFVRSTKAQDIGYFIDIAFKKSPVLKSQIHKANASLKLYKKESILNQNPVLSLGYSNIPLSEWPALDRHPMSGISIGISQFIATPWEDTYRKRTFYQKYLSEKDALEETKNLLAFQVMSTYHNIHFLYKKKQIMNENKQVLLDILRLTESLVSVNKMNSSQLLKIKADIFALSTRITELDGMISREQANMEKLCGGSLEWSVTDKSSGKWIDLNIAQVIPAGFHVKNHPLYKTYQALYESQRAAYQLEIAKLNPGVIFGFDYRIRKKIEGRDSGEDFISFKASTPIPLFYAFKEHHSIKASEEKENELKEVLRSIEIDLSARWKGASDSHSMLLDAFLSFDKEVLPGYLAAYQAQMASLSAGTINLLDVLDTYRLYLNASLEHARLYRDLLISKLRMNYLLYSYPGKN